MINFNDSINEPLSQQEFHHSSPQMHNNSSGFIDSSQTSIETAPFDIEPPPQYPFVNVHDTNLSQERIPLNELNRNQYHHEQIPFEYAPIMNSQIVWSTHNSSGYATPTHHYPQPTFVVAATPAAPQLAYTYIDTSSYHSIPTPQTYSPVPQSTPSSLASSQTTQLPPSQAPFINIPTPPVTNSPLLTPQYANFAPAPAPAPYSPNPFHGQMPPAMLSPIPSYLMSPSFNTKKFKSSKKSSSSNKHNYEQQFMMSNSPNVTFVEDCCSSVIDECSNNNNNNNQYVYHLEEPQCTQQQTTTQMDTHQMTYDDYPLDYNDPSFIDDYYAEENDAQIEDDSQLACQICRGKRMCFCYFIKVGYYKFPSYLDLVHHYYKKMRQNANLTK
jgi:hypothetical protein